MNENKPADRPAEPMRLLALRKRLETLGQMQADLRKEYDAAVHQELRARIHSQALGDPALSDLVSNLASNARNATEWLARHRNDERNDYGVRGSLSQIVSEVEALLRGLEYKMGLRG